MKFGYCACCDLSPTHPSIFGGFKPSVLSSNTDSFVVNRCFITWLALNRGLTLRVSMVRTVAHNNSYRHSECLSNVELSQYWWFLWTYGYYQFPFSYQAVQLILVIIECSLLSFAMSYRNRRLRVSGVCMKCARSETKPWISDASRGTRCMDHAWSEDFLWLQGHVFA